MAVQLATAVVKLVAAREREGKETPTSYLKEYITGETGVSCGKSTKRAKIKEALRELGFIKILKEGKLRCGATMYGLKGRMAELFSPDGHEGLSQEFELPDDIDQQIAQTVTSFEEQQAGADSDHYDSMTAVTKSEDQPQIHLTQDPVFNQLLERGRERYGDHRANTVSAAPYTPRESFI